MMYNYCPSWAKMAQRGFKIEIMAHKRVQSKQQIKEQISMLEEKFGKNINKTALVALGLR